MGQKRVYVREKNHRGLVVFFATAVTAAYLVFRINYFNDFGLNR